MRIGITGKTNKQEVFKVVGDLSGWLSERRVETYVDEGIGKEIDHPNSVPRSLLPEVSDVVLVFGGDGTFLDVARLVCRSNIPILGVNLGGLGFLTEITMDELYPVLENIINGEYVTEKREMLSASLYRNSKRMGDYFVLNDVVICKGVMARVIDLEMYINGSSITSYRADGLILSTPTGSTAYSLSAGGPIVYPTLPLTIITPISPHMLTNRPLVVSNESTVRVKVLTETSDIYLTLDGQLGVNLERDDEIEVRKSDNSVKLIRSPFRDYFTILKTKLMWGK